jgi:hypothetical protein
MTTKSPSSKAIDSVIQNHVKPFLKAEGFRKSARSFHRAKGEVIQVVNFQASMWNTPEGARFTINLNIVLPAFHEKWTGKPVPKNPSSAAAVCAYRIGLLMPEGKDHWWEVTPDSDTVSISREVADAIKEIGLPFLDKASELEYLLIKLQAEAHFPGIVMNKSLAAAILLSCMNRYEEARETIGALRERNTHAGFGETIERVAARLGLASNHRVNRSD